MDRNSELTDEFIVYGEGGAYYCETRKHSDKEHVQQVIHGGQPIVGKTFEPDFEVQVQPIDIKSTKKKESAFHSSYFLPNADGFYLLGGDSGQLYLCARNHAILSFVAHSKYLAAICSHPIGFITAAGDGLWKLWEINNINRGLLQRPESYHVGMQTPRTTLRKLKQVLRVKLEDKFHIPKYRIGGGAHACIYNRLKEQLIIGTNECDIIMVEKLSEKVFHYIIYIFPPQLKYCRIKPIVTGHGEEIVDSQMLGTSLPAKRATVCKNGVVRVWNFDPSRFTAVCEQTYSIRNSNGKISAIGWTADNKHLIVGTTSNKLLIYLTEPFKLIKTVFIPNDLNSLKKSSIDASSTLQQGTQKSELPTIKVICCSFNGKLCAIGYGRKGYILDLRKGKTQFSLWDFNTIETHHPISHMRYETQYFTLSMNKNTLRPTPMLPPWTTEWWPKLPLTNWSLQGFYQDQWKDNELNDGDCLAGHSLAVSGDKFGNIRLHAFPVLTPQALCCVSHHSTPVTSLFFLKDEKYFVSVNGHNKSVFCWKVEGVQQLAFLRFCSILCKVKCTDRLVNLSVMLVFSFWPKTKSNKYIKKAKT
ncbi:hypothetical protein RFI_17937 [Reticulomyxa filosa]|uniref:Uncharacterized protein n=1 Tax=Reticulomyxa filosa TaxID=46433 RepID=X6N070_RETFI|nr:hypothetical protein RFI_17937 [Reticulomyxa filosa]|eukprot:ETO19293.1 hypothetical protein RFI_17937 [Reticulomyxa filosa]